MKVSNKSITVRPTLIVGLGGTGVLICQWIEDYIRKLFGSVPPFIRFLKLDTDVLEEGGPPSQADFINLLHHLDVGEVVRDNEAHPEFHPHLDWLRGFGLDASFADYGCQGIPRIGRLVFMELRETIHKAVAARFSDLRSCTQIIMENNLEQQFTIAPNGAPAVHLASSVCGGTGAGMLIDMAYNLRWWSKESFPKAAEIIGHLMLPEAFSVDPRLHPKLQAVAAATLEQIEFFSDSHREKIPVHYRESDGKHSFEKLTAPFNFLYLLNGQGDVGSGNRKHLVKMIAKVIQTMTIEPMGQQVISDANNKLADILGLRDPINGHRQCFASYGLWYGTPGQHRTDIKSSICSRLEEMDAGVSSGSNNTYYEEIEKELDLHLDISTKVDQIRRSPKSCNWQLPTPFNPQMDLIADISTYFEKVYLAEIVEPAIRSGSKKIFPPDKPYKKLLDSANNIIEQNIFLAEQQLKPLGYVGLCLNQWIKQLDKRLRDKQSRQMQSYIAIKENILAYARQKVKDVASSRGTTPAGLPPQDVNTILDDIIKQNWKHMVEACLSENLFKSVKQTIMVFQLRRQAMDALVSLALGGSIFDNVGDGHSDDKGNDKEQEKDFFSTPLYTTLEPTNCLDPTNKVSYDLTKNFRNNLIKPILNSTVLTLDKISHNSGDIKDRDIKGYIRRKLENGVNNLEKKINTFLDEVEQAKRHEFYTDAQSKEPTSHAYYKSVRDVNRLAIPKINLDDKNVYAKPLDVHISQHVKNCCVPSLLTYDLGSTFREAHVTESYEKETKVWFQLLRLRYGFCLEAISTYKSYVAVIEDYITPRRFKYSDVWLDRKWYMAYQAAKKQWKLDNDNFRKDIRIGKDKYNTIALLFHKMQKSIEVIFIALYQGISEFASASEVDKAVEAAVMCKEIEIEVNNIWSNLDPANSRNIIMKGLKSCEKLMIKVLSPKSSILGQFPEETQRIIRETWNGFQQHIKEFTDMIDQ